MSDRPILFSGPMVRALLDGRKTQTRRVLKPQPYGDVIHYGWEQDAGARWTDQSFDSYRMPFWVGDLLWVREAHYLTDDGESEYAVYAEDEADVAEHLKEMQTLMASHPKIDWSKHLRPRPSIHMPRWASRLTLRVTDVRVQRVQEIREGDAVAEGIERDTDGWFDYQAPSVQCCVTARDSFMTLWDSLNAPRGYGWDANPWVAAYTFDVIRQNVNEVAA